MVMVMACYSGYRNKHVWDRVEIELRKSLVLKLGESTVLMGHGHGSIHLHLHLGKRISAVTVPDYPNDPNDQIYQIHLIYLMGPMDRDANDPNDLNDLISPTPQRPRGGRPILIRDRLACKCQESPTVTLALEVLKE